MNPKIKAYAKDRLRLAGAALAYWLVISALGAIGIYFVSRKPAAAAAPVTPGTHCDYLLVETPRGVSRYEQGASYEQTGTLVKVHTFKPVGRGLYASQTTLTLSGVLVVDCVQIDKGGR